MPAPHPGQEWKHGWIPITPNAARQKNHGRKPGEGSKVSQMMDAAIRERAGKSASKPANSAHFARDLDKINATLKRLGAVITLSDGTQAVDPSKAPPGLIRTYRRLLAHGAANGLL